MVMNAGGWGREGIKMAYLCQVSTLNLFYRAHIARLTCSKNWPPDVLGVGRLLMMLRPAASPYEKYRRPHGRWQLPHRAPFLRRRMYCHPPHVHTTAGSPFLHLITPRHFARMCSPSLASSASPMTTVATSSRMVGSGSSVGSLLMVSSCLVACAAGSGLVVGCTLIFLHGGIRPLSFG